MSLEKNSYDYVYESALIASSVTANYMLSMDQHLHLIVDSIPSSAEKNLISKCTTLENLLDVISTLAPCLKTRSQIEEQIKQWSLVTLSTESITRSVSKLTDLIEAIHSDSPLPYPELFRTIISRILLEKLPERVNKELVEARHKICNGDNLNTLLQLLLSVLYSLVGYKPKQSTNQGTGFPQVKAIQEQPEISDFDTIVPHLVAAVQAASAQSVVPPLADSRNPNAGVPKQHKNDGGVVLATEKTITMVTPETRVCKLLPNLEIKTAIAMETKGNLKENFLLLHLGLIISLIPVKVVTVCQRNVRSTLQTTVFVVE
jgi:hypothetical protein